MIDTTVNTVGSLTVLSGGVTSGTTVWGGYGEYLEYSAGIEYVSSGAVADNTVLSGGILDVFGGAASTTTVESGGTENVASGGSAVSTTVNRGGAQSVSAGGTPVGTVVNGGDILRCQERQERRPTADRQHPAPASVNVPPPATPDARDSGPYRHGGTGLGCRPRLPHGARLGLLPRQPLRPFLGALHPAGVHARQWRDLAASSSGRPGEGAPAHTPRDRGDRRAGQSVGNDPRCDPRRRAHASRRRTAGDARRRSDRRPWSRERLLHTSGSADLDEQLRNEALALELSSRSEDFREGLSAFREKRDPGFSGR